MKEELKKPIIPIMTKVKGLFALEPPKLKELCELHTSTTPVDEYGRCILCGKDVNAEARHRIAAKLAIENDKLTQAVFDEKARTERAESYAKSLELNYAYAIDSEREKTQASNKTIKKQLARIKALSAQLALIRKKYKLLEKAKTIPVKTRYEIGLCPGCGTQMRVGYKGKEVWCSECTLHSQTGEGQYNEREEIDLLDRLEDALWTKEELMC